MNLDGLLNIEISYQDHFWTEITQKKLSGVIEEITGERHRDFTKYLRTFYNTGDKENYDLHKRKLPVVTFCGTYKNERTKDHIEKYNSLIVLDIDKLGESGLIKTKECLLKDEYVFAFWESPSRDGIKGLVHLTYNFDIEKYGVDISHKIAFKQLMDYFVKTYEIVLDKSGNDITRLCFISWDDKLVLKNNVLSFSVSDNPIVDLQRRKILPTKAKQLTNDRLKNVLFNPFGKNDPYHRRTMKMIIKYLTKNSKSITNSYPDWLRVAFAISNIFTYDVGLKYFIELSKLDQDKFKEVECEKFLINCYLYNKRKIGFKTIIHLASEKGYKYKVITAESNQTA